MLGRLDVLRIVSNKFEQCHNVHVQGVDVCRRDVKIETSRRPTCVIDLIWSQSQLGHPKELKIQKSGLKLWKKSFQEICLRPPPLNVWREFTLVQYLCQIKEPAVVPTS